MLGEILIIFGAILTIILLFIKQKSKLYVIVSILIILIGTGITLYDRYEPTKELQITVAKIFSLDEISSFSLQTDHIFLFQGCGYKTLHFVHNRITPDKLKDEELHYTYTSTERYGCENCTYYYFEIHNRGKDINEPLNFLVVISDQFILDESDSKINVQNSRNIPDRNNFIYEIVGGIKGNFSETLAFRGHTNKYSNINIDCSAIKKSKCYIIQYDIGDMRNAKDINQFFSDTGINPPEYNPNEMEAYELNDNNEFKRLPLKLDYLYFTESVCKKESQDINPSLIKKMI